MESAKKTWKVCDDCEGSGLDPEAGKAREGQYLNYCTKCKGKGGWIHYEHTRDA